VAAEELEDAERSRGPVGLQSMRPAADAPGMNPVHVLRGKNVLQKLVLGKVRRKGQLQDDAVNAAIGAQPPERLVERRRGRVFERT